jgi:ATP-dependent Zn proteases
MNLKNLTMWGIIALLVLGLFNLFQNPATLSPSKDLPFSTFISEVDKGNVVSVDIKGSSLVGKFANGTQFRTYSPNYPNLVEKLSSKGVSFSAGPIEDKMPSFFGVLLSWFPMLLLIAVWIFLCARCKVAKAEPWDLENLKQNY